MLATGQSTLNTSMPMDESESAKRVKELASMLRNSPWTYFVTITVNDMHTPGIYIYTYIYIYIYIYIYGPFNNHFIATIGAIFTTLAIVYFVNITFILFVLLISGTVLICCYFLVALLSFVVN
jgi:hypothetical protein